MSKTEIISFCFLPQTLSLSGLLLVMSFQFLPSVMGSFPPLPKLETLDVSGMSYTAFSITHRRRMALWCLQTTDPMVLI